MRTLITALFLCGWLATSAFGQATPTTATDSSSGTSATQGERWRYVYHEGRWWYYLPNEQWVIWSGARWISQHELAQQTATQQTAVVEQPQYGVEQPRYQANYQPSTTYEQPVYQQQTYQVQATPWPFYSPWTGRTVFGMPYVPWTENPATSQPVTGAGQR